MSYEAKPNGTHTLACDIPNCNRELIGPTQDELFEDANLLGWIEHQNRNVCPDCARGIGTGATAIKAMFGTPTIEAPARVKQGDPVLNDQGVQIGTFARDAEAGEIVEIDLLLPADQQVPVSEKYAAILGRDDGESEEGNPAGYSEGDDEPRSENDELFEGFGDLSEAKRNAPQEARQRPVSGPKQPDPGEDLSEVFGRHGRAQVKPQPPRGKSAMAAPAGTSGGAGLVKEPPRPSPEEIKRAKANAPKKSPKGGIDTDKLLETASLFGSIDSGWTPDDK